MATPADQRLLELLEKWLTSLELHTKYASLDAASYSKMQPWPEHERPSRWIIDLARQKTLALQAQLQERIKTGDTKFSDSLELMIFLANLVGSQHIERFIPLAEVANEASAGPDPTVLQPIATQETPSHDATGTREMPQFVGGRSREATPAPTERVTRTERKSAAPEPAAKVAATKGAAKGKPAASAPASKAAPAATPAGPSTVYDHNGPTQAARDQVIADAARLVQWGRKWYELAELISSMSDRPHVTDVRRILKDNKELIDKKAGRN